MIRNLGSFAALSLVGLAGCGQQEPAAAPLAPPPAATVAAAPAPVVEAKKEEPKPVPLTAEQKVKGYQEGWAAFNAKDFGKFHAIWAPEATSEMLDMGPPLLGPSAIVEQGAKRFASAFPDSTGELELTLVNGNNILGVVLTRGTQTGIFVTPTGSVPPTNKKVGFLMAHGIELNDAGKAVKEVLAYDGGTLAGQLGLMTMPHRKALETGWTDKPVVIASGSEVEKANLAAMAKEVESFNKHDAAGALATAADDIVFSEVSAPADRVGKKESLKGVEDMFKAFPDAKLDVKSSWAAGDYVVATGTWSGTNTGVSPAMKVKTGKAVSVHFIEIDKFAAGKTKNIWLFSNGAAAAAQLGLLPPKGAEPKGKEAKPGAAKPLAEAKPAAAKPTAEAKPAAAKPAAAKVAATPAKPTPAK
jgi:predicted ester cyclase